MRSGVIALASAQGCWVASVAAGGVLGGCDQVFAFEIQLVRTCANSYVGPHWKSIVGCNLY